MILSVNSDKTSIFTEDGRELRCSCIVRNELNGWRSKNQVVWTEPSPGVPYYPRAFPLGTWNVVSISKINPEDDPLDYEIPYFIHTDAWQMVEEWSLHPEDGSYLENTHRMVKDSGYGLHYSKSNTTLGCLKILELDDLLWLVQTITPLLDGKDRVILEVT